MAWKIFQRSLLTLSLLATSIPAPAQMKASEFDLKAAIIINMVMFVEWPQREAPPSDDTLTVCFIDNSPVAKALANAQGKSIRNKTISIRKATLETVSGCHVVYVSPTERDQLQDLTTRLQSTPVLIAGDSPDYLRRGVMLNLELSEGHIIFDINQSSARKAGLQISSKALRLARQVVE